MLDMSDFVLLCVLCELYAVLVLRLMAAGYLADGLLIFLAMVP